MFILGNYKVRFRHQHKDFVHEVDEDICGKTTCELEVINNRNGGLHFITYTIECVKGENLSKNNRRKDTLAIVLQELFPTNGNNYRKALLNKRARTLFWNARSAPNVIPSCFLVN